MDLARFPALPMGASPRRLYYEALGPDLERELVLRGYEPVVLATLPRGRDSDDHAYLVAKLQGIEEGTVFCDEESRKRLELSCRVHGMLDRQTRALSIKVNADGADLLSILGWGSSRHTLADNSTVVAAQPLREAAHDRLCPDSDDSGNQ